MSRVIEHLSDYREEADLRRETFGKTNKYITGMVGLDAYLGHGFGNPHGYEIITVFGESGVGKSTFALNMVAHEMKIGTKVGLMVLEDDMPDVYNRILQIVSEAGMNSITRNKNVDVLPQEMLQKAWSFDDVLNWIEQKHLEREIDLFLVDHINFIFDNAQVVQGEKEMVAQRKFMLHLNFMCKKYKLTVILVAHTAKGDTEGMDKIYGTTAIPQVSTKVIGVKIGEQTDINIAAPLMVRLYKSRFTVRQEKPWALARSGLRLAELEIQPYIAPSSKKK